jgi:hypothetical protein
MTDPQPTPDAGARRRLRIAQAEADLAYFQARLALIGEPNTLNQYAQRCAFQMLYKAVGQKLAKLSGKST